MATVVKSYRIRAYPNGAQQRMLARWFGAARWLWNTALEIRSAAYREFGLKLTGNDISLWLTQWKRTAGHEWLAEVPATCLTQCLRNQERALSIHEKLLGPDHPHTARSLEGLAIQLQHQGDLVGARPLHVRALAIREKILGPEHRQQAAGLAADAWYVR